MGGARSTMVTTESPAVARRRLRLALRKIRDAKGLTQGQVAEALEWSLSKVNRVESGEVTISSTDLRALLAYLGVSDSTMIEQLTADARASRRRGWWDEPRYRDHLTVATLQLLQFEGEASVIRCFQPTLIPGLLQTRAYAEAILTAFSDDLSDHDRAVRLEVRMRRRAQVFDQPDPPPYVLILDESVVLREVGGPMVMAEQLQDTLAAAQRPDIEVHIIPLAKGAHFAMQGGFTLVDLGDEENAVLYREVARRDEIVHTPEMITRHRRLFERMFEESLGREASMRLIQARAATMLASLDRR
jgi:transcriptional regulator with XRE-family HTH domain